MKSRFYDIAVIGAGGGGIMAVLRAVLNFDQTVLFTGDAQTRRRGRATWVNEVENIPGMHALKKPIAASTERTLEWVEQQPELRKRFTLIAETVRAIRKAEDGFDLSYEVTKKPATLRARFVILATGVMDVQPEIGGSIKPVFPFANRGDFIYCVRCDGHKTHGHRLTIIGHSDNAIQIGRMMQERYGHKWVGIITNGHRGDFSEKTKKIAQEGGMEIFYEPIQEILSEEGISGRLAGFRFQDFEVKTSSTIIALGNIVHNKLLTNLGGKVDAEGKAIVTEKYETSVRNLFVVGDLASGSKMQIYTAWDQAVDAADEINRRLRQALRATGR